MRKNEFKISKWERFLLTGERISLKTFDTGTKISLAAMVLAFICSGFREYTVKRTKNENNYGNARKF